MRRSPIFLLSLLLKGFNGIWETVSGGLVLFIGSQWLTSSFYRLTANELLEDPNDRLVDLAGNILRGASADAVRFAAAYLLLHGLLNIFLSIQPFRRKLWAYPTAIIVNLAAMAYQVHRVALHHSVFLTLITILDAIFVLFALAEYRRERGRQEIESSK